MSEFTDWGQQIAREEFQRVVQDEHDRFMRIKDEMGDDGKLIEVRMGKDSVEATFPSAEVESEFKKRLGSLVK